MRCLDFHRLVLSQPSLWTLLPWQGVQKDHNGVAVLELRQCQACGSTLSKEILR